MRGAMELRAALGFLDHQALCRKAGEDWGESVPLEMLAVVD